MKVRSAIIVSALTFALVPMGINVCAARADDKPTVIIEEPAPTFVEEGSSVNGVVVVAPADVDYVFINGGWYYYHPTLQTWVHVNHEKDWKPSGKGHVFNRWSDHPMYHRK